MTRISTRQGISVNAFAKLMDVRENAIRTAVKSGRLASAVFPDGSLDEVRARVLWLKTSNPARQRTPVATSKLGQEATRARDINDVKFETMEVELEDARLKLAASKRESIPYVEARRALAAFVRLNRDVALRFAIRHGPAIAAEVGCDESALIASISSHMRQALNEAADNPKPFPKAVPYTIPAETSGDE